MNRIKELRKEKGLTLDEIQSKTGINRSTYNNYENGKTEPKPETWQALADYFNVSVPYLQGKIFKEDLSDEAQEMFEDVQDYISYVVPNELIEIVLKALLNSYEYNYESDRWK
ncbi:helix-turn-helix domain-containing protein [Lactobacillus johnsonii]|uniref:helix-turn-helix domain-containing protein n=1 Tax=Lactobacillus johnsonii TaxID=33959 RepID=UPI001FB413FE|nr:helix-turn-helix transcriptional regulator [Lactobacillus johnsonii]UOC07197.1 helix-turn-helix domain-containing protein [Lactobacillus johnsonii]